MAAADVLLQHSALADNRPWFCRLWLPPLWRSARSARTCSETGAWLTGSGSARVSGAPPPKDVSRRGCLVCPFCAASKDAGMARKKENHGYVKFYGGPQRMAPPAARNTLHRTEARIIYSGDTRNCDCRATAAGQGAQVYTGTDCAVSPAAGAHQRGNPVGKVSQ